MDRVGLPTADSDESMGGRWEDGGEDEAGRGGVIPFKDNESPFFERKGCRERIGTKEGAGEGSEVRIMPDKEEGIGLAGQ